MCAGNTMAADSQAFGDGF